MKIAVFVDGSNLFYSQVNQLGWFVDLKKLLSYIGRQGHIVAAYYYTAVDEDDDPKRKAFLDAIPDMGYSLVTKPVKVMTNSQSGEKVKKGNLDIEIVIDMFSTIDQYDMAVLVSGDGDFERALDLLKIKGKQFQVFSTEGSVAKEIRNIAGLNYIELQNLRKELERPHAHE